MSIGDSITLVSCLAGLMVALPGLMVVLNMAFSRTTEQAVMRLSTGAKTPFIVGLLTVIVIGYVSFGLLSMGSVFQLFGAVLVLILLCWMITGMGVVARLIGLKLSQLATQADVPLTRPFTEIVLGAFALTLAIAFPLVGWFLLLPTSWVVGSGAIILAFFNRRADTGRSAVTPDIPRFVPDQMSGD